MSTINIRGRNQIEPSANEEFYLKVFLAFHKEKKIEIALLDALEKELERKIINLRELQSNPSSRKSESGIFELTASFNPKSVRKAKNAILIIANIEIDRALIKDVLIRKKKNYYLVGWLVRKSHELSTKGLI